MISKQAQLDTLELLAKHEETLRDLYNAIGEKFPEHRSFFHRIAADESSHAAWLRELKPMIEAEVFKINERRFALLAIEKALHYARTQVDLVNNPLSNLSTCLATGLDLERGMLEEKYYEVLEDDEPELKNVLLRLAEGTRFHRTAIKELLDKYRFQ
jgi:hypothetical protein